MGKGGEGRRREGRAGEGKFAPAPSKYIWIDAAAGLSVLLLIPALLLLLLLLAAVIRFCLTSLFIWRSLQVRPSLPKVSQRRHLGLWYKIFTGMDAFFVSLPM